MTTDADESDSVSALPLPSIHPPNKQQTQESEEDEDISPEEQQIIEDLKKINRQLKEVRAERKRLEKKLGITADEIVTPKEREPPYLEDSEDSEDYGAKV